MDWTQVLQSLCFWGPGAVLAGLIIWALYRLADKFIDKFATDFINAQREQAASLAKLAQGTEGLRDSVQSFVMRDNQEHREITILLKCIMEKVTHVEERIDDGR